jgi:hypothetical protein
LAVRETGVEQVHLSISRQAPDRSAAGNPAVHFGADLPTSELTYRTVDPDGVRRARTLLDGLCQNP